MTNRSERIRTTLTQAFAPEDLDVVDDSARHAGHAGHAGASPEGETHFKVRIVSKKFDGMSRVAMQRAVNDALKSEFESGLHALNIRASAPAG
ncbi:BolA family protein [Henriciella aquimarina]|uniref:BolA family protein n=1 Tax=Henriciella aquimarina TaxID=545261 RepID=UPI0009FF17E0|nr:BolA family protein [Henriciella aquimarina]